MRKKSEGRRVDLRRYGLTGCSCHHSEQRTNISFSQNMPSDMTKTRTVSRRPRSTLRDDRNTTDLTIEGTSRYHKPGFRHIRTSSVVEANVKTEGNSKHFSHREFQKPKIVMSIGDNPSRKYLTGLNKKFISVSNLVPDYSEQFLKLPASEEKRKLTNLHSPVESSQSTKLTDREVRLQSSRPEKNLTLNCRGPELFPRLIQEVDEEQVNRFTTPKFSETNDAVHPLPPPSYGSNLLYQKLTKVVGKPLLTKTNSNAKLDQAYSIEQFTEEYRNLVIPTDIESILKVDRGNSVDTITLSGSVVRDDADNMQESTDTIRVIDKIAGKLSEVDHECFKLVNKKQLSAEKQDLQESDCSSSSKGGVIDSSKYPNLMNLLSRCKTSQPTSMVKNRMRLGFQKQTKESNLTSRAEPKKNSLMTHRDYRVVYQEDT